MVFLPPNEAGRAECARIFETVVREEGQEVLGWRDVPTDNATLGPTAQASQPVIRQILVGRGPDCPDAMSFERKLYVIRRLVEKKVSRSAIPGRTHFYVPSLSHKTIVYKGMLNAPQLRAFYPDLSHPALVTAIAMVLALLDEHVPSWSRAHPYRYISHNGEINTLRGNINWMRAPVDDALGAVRRGHAEDPHRRRQRGLRLGDVRQRARALDAHRARAAARHDDDGAGALEPARVVEDPAKRAFCEFHSCLMEPWDGPRPDRVHRRRRSERSSTGTACAPRATT